MASVHGSGAEDAVFEAHVFPEVDAALHAFVDEMGGNNWAAGNERDAHVFHLSMS
jgi:N-acetyl-beta-hexosaminidase